MTGRSPDAPRPTRTVRTATQPPAGARPSRPGRDAAPATASRPSRPTRDGSPTAAAPAQAAPVAGGRPSRPGGAPAARAGQTAGGAAAPQRPHRGPAQPEAIAPTPGGPVPGKPEGKPGDLLTVMTELAALLEVENAALVHHQYGPVQEHSERKQMLTRLYIEQAVGIRRNPAHVAALPAEHRALLKAAAAKVDVLAVENQRLLKSGMAAIERFLGAVVKAAREKQTKEALVYGENGMLDDRPPDHRPISVAVNREL